jgi:hypothetical protein
MILIFLYLFLPFLWVTISRMHVISELGTEFLPIDPNELLLTARKQSQMMCATACHQQWACRTFDYDPISHWCRLYEGDLTTGSTIVNSSLPNSIVASIEFSLDLYVESHNQPCQACEYSRYEQRVNNSCQCPLHTYWNGNQCLSQFFENQPCTQADACRQDLNLTCMPCYQDTFT